VNFSNQKFRVLAGFETLGPVRFEEFLCRRHRSVELVRFNFIVLTMISFLP
jgi:hypothetical protein